MEPSDKCLNKEENKALPKTSYQIEKEFIRNLKDETMKTLEEWIQIVDRNGSTKRHDIVNHLKNDHGFGHVNASLLAGIYLNGGKPVYSDPNELLTGIFIYPILPGNDP